MGRHIQASLKLLLALVLVTALLPFAAAADDGSGGREPRSQGEEVPLGCVLSPTVEGDLLAAPVRISGTLPDSVDLRAGLPPVGDQGRQNSCVAWAVGYYYKSYQEAREQLWSLASQDHQFSPAFIYNQRPTANCKLDRGMTIVAALRILQQGAAPLSMVPYTERDTCTRLDASALAVTREYRAGAYAALFQGKGQANIEQIKAHLAGGDPVVMAIPVYTNFRYATASTAVVGAPPAGSTSLGTHAVLAVGYDPRGILIVNSWGTRWGNGGFAYLTYDFVQRYAYEAWIMQDVDATPPKLPTSCSPATPPASPEAARSGASAQGSGLSFTWSGATDNGGSGIKDYRVYWGTDPNGQSPAVVTAEPIFSCGPIPAGPSYYLRVQVVDRAGNASAWKTLQALALAP